MGSCCSDGRVQRYEAKFDVKKTANRISKKGEVSQFSQKFQGPGVEGYINNDQRLEEYMYFKSLARKDPTEFPHQIVQSNITPKGHNKKKKPKRASSSSSNSSKKSKPSRSSSSSSSDGKKKKKRGEAVDQMERDFKPILHDLSNSSSELSVEYKPVREKAKRVSFADEPKWNESQNPKGANPDHEERNEARKKRKNINKEFKNLQVPKEVEIIDLNRDGGMTSSKPNLRPRRDGEERVEMKKKKPKKDNKDKLESKQKKDNKVILRKESDIAQGDILRTKEQGQFDSRILSPFRMGNMPIEDTSTAPRNNNMDNSSMLPSRVTFIPY
ncbi:unnamed protein product [Moneuplotes crassus]|uniref:Uncharacterized protein n=1 Tax=Euplotes crassus TaxID=5936 RepID=A0AAD2CWC9_EUPCR|nr:unnamed protein product [Moneuplotes crassus]